MENLIFLRVLYKDITFKISGYVEKIYADFTGKYIKKGEPLFSIYSPELVIAQEEFLRAYRYLQDIKSSGDKFLLTSAKELYESAYKKLLYWDLSEKQIENLKKTGKVLKNIILYSPYEGWIVEKRIFLGSKINPGEVVFRVAEKRKLWLIVKVFEKDIPFLKKNTTVNVSFSAYQDKIFQGKIDYIYPFLDKKERTVNVRIVLEDKSLLPGMYGKVFLKVPLGERLSLPETAVLDTGRRKVVFLETEEGVFEPVFVKTGIYADGFYEIKEGLHEGMIVANSALFLLDADAQLRGLYKKEKKGMNMMHHHH